MFLVLKLKLFSGVQHYRRLTPTHTPAFTFSNVDSIVPVRLCKQATVCSNCCMLVTPAEVTDFRDKGQQCVNKNGGQVQQEILSEETDVSGWEQSCKLRLICLLEGYTFILMFTLGGRFGLKQEMTVCWQNAQSLQVLLCHYALLHTILHFIIKDVDSSLLPTCLYLMQHVLNSLEAINFYLVQSSATLGCRAKNLSRQESSILIISSKAHKKYIFHFQKHYYLTNTYKPDKHQSFTVWSKPFEESHQSGKACFICLLSSFKERNEDKLWQMIKKREHQTLKCGLMSMWPLVSH